MGITKNFAAMDIRTSFVLVVTFCLGNHWAAGQPTRHSSRVKRCAVSPCPYQYGPGTWSLHAPWLREYSGNNEPKQMKPNDCENGMMSQMPIAFEDSKMKTKSEPNFLKFGGHPGTQQPQCNEYPTCYVFGQLFNNGHTLMFVPKTNDPVLMVLPTADFSLQHIHFHWGSADDRGSEHMVNGKAYPLEMHLVFEKRSSTLQRMMSPDVKLAVFAVFFEVANQDYVTLFDDELEEMIKGQGLPGTGNNTAISTGINLNFIKPLENQKFYHYEKGSLSDRPCNESVEYLVAKKPLLISGNMLVKLRQLEDKFGDPLVDNFRPSSRPNSKNVDVHMHV